MAKQDVRIEGLDELIKQLDLQPSEVVRRLNPVVAAHTKAMESSAKANVPVDQGVLKASIESEVQETDSWVFGRVRATDQKAHLVEYGTVNMVEQPFMAPAFESTKSAFQADVKKALEGK